MREREEDGEEEEKEKERDAITGGESIDSLSRETPFAVSLRVYASV